MPGFNFGTGGMFSSSTTTTASSTTPQFCFTGTPSTASASTTSSAFSFKGLSTATASTSASTPSSSAFSFKFSTPTTTTASVGFSSFNLGTNPVALNLATKTTSTPTIGTGTITTTSSASFSFAPPASSAPTTGASTKRSLFSSTNVSTPITILSGSKDASAPSVPPASSSSMATTGSSLFSTSASLTTATTTTSASAPGVSLAQTNLPSRPLEERLNKWLVELKEQEERFVRQVAHVNAWDQILQNGHDQVQNLKDTLHRVKSDQSRLEAEIDFIRGQQEELERLLEPLESATASNPATQLHQGDRQRDNMYYMAQSLDAQLRQMTDDLGKVIEHLNINVKPWQPNDPVALVARILSAHMDTLKWVDQNSALLSQKVEEVARVASNVAKRV